MGRFRQLTPWTARTLVVLALLVPATIAPAQAQQAPQSTPVLSDIEGNWAQQAILSAVAGGYVTGYPDHTFHPDADVTRAEALTMLVRALSAAKLLTRVSLGTAYIPGPFNTEDPTHWVMTTGLLPTALATGIVTEGDLISGAHPTFAPDMAASKMEITRWLARAIRPSLETYLQIRLTRESGTWSADARQAAAIPGTEGKWLFSDVTLADDQAYVMVVSNAGLIQGLTTTRFGPTGHLTRSQMVQIIQRIGATPLPKDPAHASILAVREGGYEPNGQARALTSRDPGDLPAIQRLVAALSSAQAAVLPATFVMPEGRNQNWLAISYSDGSTSSLSPVLRCEDLAAGRSCSDEPGWMIGPSGPVRSALLWEYFHGQRHLDMPQIISNAASR